MEGVNYQNFIEDVDFPQFKDKNNLQDIIDDSSLFIINLPDKIPCGKFELVVRLNIWWKIFRVYFSWPEKNSKLINFSDANIDYIVENGDKSLSVNWLNKDNVEQCVICELFKIFEGISIDNASNYRNFIRIDDQYINDIEKAISDWKIKISVFWWYPIGTWFIISWNYNFPSWTTFKNNVVFDWKFKFEWETYFGNNMIFWDDNEFDWKMSFWDNIRFWKRNRLSWKDQMMFGWKVYIGYESYIYAPCVFNDNVNLGNNVLVDADIHCMSAVNIGEFVTLKQNVIFEDSKINIWPWIEYLKKIKFGKKVMYLEILKLKFKFWKSWLFNKL